MAIRKNQVLVDTSEFYRSYYREPKGRGAWAFAYSRNAAIDDVLWFTGTYADARRQAVAAAAAAGQCVIYVLS